MKLNSISAIYRGFNHIVHNVSEIKNGQADKYAILQDSHRLEKGMCIRNPRAGWGYDKAEKLVKQISREKQSINPDNMAVLVGEAVLAAYIRVKEKCAGEAEKLESLKDEISASGILVENNTEFGGTLLLHKDDVLQDKTVEKLFLTRHSVRDYAETSVDKEKLERAITLALRAPSACNRQATQIYVISGEDRIKAGAGNEYHADKYLILTGNMDAYTLSELNDWIVSSAVFCGYLSLALHAEGIGSCVLRKEIIRKNKYNQNIKKLCHIPDNEQIILELAIGNYKDEFYVPISHRREAKDITHYLI